MKKLLTALAVTLLMTGSAFATECPKHVQAIDAALTANPSGASPEALAQAKELRDQGEALHAEGKHAESMAALTEAEKLLGIGM
jgi:hypothetical protein